jgi:MFS family permease
MWTSWSRPRASLGPQGTALEWSITLIMNDPPATAIPHTATPAGSPFRHRAFTVIWIATVASNIGGWMYNVASGWLMTSLDSNALIVSLVQVANSLPMFLFAIPAGALADIVNQRRFLIFGESTITIVSIAFAALVWLDLITPVSLLLFGVHLILLQ